MVHSRVLAFHGSGPAITPFFRQRQTLMTVSRMLVASTNAPIVDTMMVEYGEQFWRSGWAPLYGVLGGNPLAAMPSLHFATSVTAAHVLTETGGVAGLLGWTYTALLGTALVYLGEHYVVDLMPSWSGGCETATRIRQTL